MPSNHDFSWTLTSGRRHERVRAACPSPRRPNRDLTVLSGVGSARKDVTVLRHEAAQKHIDIELDAVGHSRRNAAGIAGQLDQSLPTRPTSRPHTERIRHLVGCSPPKSLQSENIPHVNGQAPTHHRGRRHRSRQSARSDWADFGRFRQRHLRAPPYSGKKGPCFSRPSSSTS